MVKFGSIAPGLAIKKRPNLVFICMLVLGFCVSERAVAENAVIQPSEDGEFAGSAQPADVLLAVEAFDQDLELVRNFMGKPKVSTHQFRAEFAAPRHVYYQAQTLFRKANRLAAEVAGATKQTPPPAPELDSILPENVLTVVKQAQNQLGLVFSELGLEAPERRTQRNVRAQPKDVFNAILQLNRQINLMISERFEPADVNQLLSLTSVYLAGVLDKAGLEKFPAETFIPNLQPVDIYHNLLDCLVLNQRIGKQLDLPVLQINERRLKKDQSILSDNYGLAMVLLIDVAYWSAKLDHSDDIFPEAEVVKHIFPAHVAAKAKAVEAQLQLMSTHLEQNAPE